MGLTYLSNNISKLDSGIITSYALYILTGLIFYLFIAYISAFENIILIIILFSMLNLLYFTDKE